MEGKRLEKDLGKSDAPKFSNEKRQHGGNRERAQTQLGREGNVFQLYISECIQGKVTTSLGRNEQRGKRTKDTAKGYHEDITVLRNAFLKLQSIIHVVVKYY